MAYVYGHYKADTGELFYIGKGTGSRAWCKDSRNPYWKNIVKKHGLEVRILEDNLTDAEALDKEKQLIEEIGLDNLANLTEGGGAPPPKQKGSKWDPVHVAKRVASLKAKDLEDPSRIERRKLTIQKTAKDPQRNKKISEWRKANPVQRKSQKGRKFTEEHKRKLREAKRRA